jgi:hypothetical protein
MSIKINVLLLTLLTGVATIKVYSAVCWSASYVICATEETTVGCRKAGIGKCSKTWTGVCNTGVCVEPKVIAVAHTVSPPSGQQSTTDTGRYCQFVCNYWENGAWHGADCYTHANCSPSTYPIPYGNTCAGSGG